MEKTCTRTNNKVGRLLIQWMEDIPQEEVDYRLENWEEFGYIEKTTEERVFKDLCEDCGYWNMEWEYLTEHLTEVIQKKNSDGYWHAQVENFGWRSLSGEKYFYADKGSDFLQEILPKTDNHFKIYNWGRGIAINNAHHDSPVWKEWYYIKPVAQSTYEKHRH